MEIMKKYLGEDDVMITTTYMNLGMAYDEMGQYDRAEKYLQQAMDVRITKLPQKHPDIADCLLNLGILHSKTNNMKSALRETKKAYIMLEETLGNDNPTTKNAREHYQKLLKISKVSIT
jgi:tetratricopeptide (TPR) repeat protein